MDITTILATDLEPILGLGALDDRERSEFLDSIGEVVFESATLRYLGEVSSEEQSLFSTWIQAHASDENMLTRLCDTYPQFENFLVEEIANFKSDAIRVFGK